MKIKKKLKDLTPEEYANWHLKNCYATKCDICPFKSVGCNIISRNTWVNNKDLYSDKFLNQEIMIEDEEPDILTDKEKQYLRNVIKPFRNRVKYITKEAEINGYEYIVMDVTNPINVSYYFDTDHIYLPYFYQGTMYNNMVLRKKYTLEELGL